VVGGGFASATDAANLFQTLTLNTNGLKKWVRVAKDIGGTSSPRFVASVVLVAFRKDRSQAISTT
jgi:hypothetical protein